MGADLLSAVALNDAPERIRGWSLMCGFQEPNFRDWSDFAKFVDDRAGSAAKHLRRVRKGRGAAVLPKVRRKKAKLVCDLAHTRSEPGLHAVLWVDGAPKCDFSQPARPQSQPAPQVQVIGQQQELDRPGTCPPSTGSKGSLGGKEKRLAKLSPLPTNHSPRHRYSGKTFLETLPPIEGLDPATEREASGSKGPQLYQLAHELRIPLELVQHATDLFSRYSEGEGSDLFQRRLRMPAFSKLLCEITRVDSLDQLSPIFVETALRSANRTNLDAIDVREFFIWYSAFSFSEEMTPNKEDHKTRRLAKKLGLEVVDVDDYRKAFDKFDADGSGAIEIDEFEDILRHLLKLPKETELEPNRVANLWRIADTNHDDVVDFEEFCLFWSQSYGGSDNSQGLENLFASVYRSLRRVPTARFG